MEEIEKKALEAAWREYSDPNPMLCGPYEWAAFAEGWKAALEQPAGIFSGPTVREALHLLIAVTTSVTTCSDVKIVISEAQDGK